MRFCSLTENGKWGKIPRVPPEMTMPVISNVSERSFFGPTFKDARNGQEGCLSTRLSFLTFVLFAVESFLTKIDLRAQISGQFEERKLGLRCAGRGLFRFFLGGKFFDLLHQSVDDLRFRDFANDFALLKN